MDPRVTPPAATPAEAALRRRVAELEDELARLRADRTARTAELEAALARLRRNEERYRYFVRGSRDGIWCLEPEPPIPLELPIDVQIERFRDCRVVELNDAAAEWRGLPGRAGAVGARLAKLGRFEAPEYQRSLRLLVESGYRLRNFQERLPREDGGQVEVVTDVYPVFADGALVRLWGIERDMTARVDAEHRDREGLERLAQVSLLDTVGELTAGLAHQLNQPLAAIVNYARGAQRRLGAEADSALLGALESTVGQAERAGAILRRLRRVVRRSEHRPVRAALHELVRETVQLMSHRARKKGVAVELELGLADDQVLADPSGVQQVLANLLRNAYEAAGRAPEGERKVQVVSAAAPDGWRVVAVHDPGPPGPECGRASPVDTFEEPPHGAAGLGLATGRAIVQTHGGRLWCEPSPRGAGGTAYCFTLPPADEEASA